MRRRAGGDPARGRAFLGRRRRAARRLRRRVVLEGREVTGWPPHRVAAAGLVRTFQIARELGRLTVLENLLPARRGQPVEAAWRALLAPFAVRRAEAAAIEDARALLERVGLWQLADEPASSLSGGQKKLLELARALMTGAQIILLDEPAAGVSPALTETLVASSGTCSRRV